MQSAQTLSSNRKRNIYRKGILKALQLVFFLSHGYFKNTGPLCDIADIALPGYLALCDIMKMINTGNI